MGSGYPDGQQEAFIICQTTINSWQAQEQLSVSKYHLGQPHLKISVLVPPSWQGQLQLRLESESPSAEAILILQSPLRNYIPGLQDHESFTCGQNKGRETVRKGQGLICVF